MDYGTYPIVAAPRRMMWETFHKLRMDCDTCPAVVAPLRFVYLVSLETPDVGDVPQTENGLRHLFRSCCSFEIDSILNSWRPQMWEMFHKLRMDYDTYPAVAAPLKLICLVYLETPDVGDVPQTENGLRHLSLSFENVGHRGLN
ncbi:hypothetical protein Taro_044280 [Colocasia esculenta]|uniref:Uncharacterized protein n=1 Tax=Colocasia esculenta TaxID=4460 RepID=A0A843X0H4_COLES|nr:hypothetical protein [Colocasia esculenta]